ncbi:MAG: hypothetical protein FJZ01_27555, partial [Candidatus Sericytochromatia bacterium]|nr:hypothetical protein [Candidatus Tanganyikabacteria bacterium]
MPGIVVAAVELGGLAAVAEMLDPEVFKATVRDLVERARTPLLEEGARVEVSPGHTLLGTWEDRSDGAVSAVAASLSILQAIQEAAREAERRLGIRFWTRIGVHAARDADVENVTIVALALKGHSRL